MELAFIGGGNMARAIIGGLLAQGRRASAIGVVEPDAAARARLASELGVAAIGQADASIASAATVVFAVKPQQMREAARACAPHVSRALVVSIAAGIRIDDLSRWLGGHGRVVRAIPNTPALVHAGVAGLCARPSVGAEDRAAAAALLAAVGEAIWFEREADLDAVTAVSGSGPAYVFYAIEALEQAARELGLDAAKSRAAKLAQERGEDPALLRAQVTSKGGTTERAVQALDGAQVKRAFVAAVKAACERSRELGEALGKDPA